MRVHESPYCIVVRLVSGPRIEAVPSDPDERGALRRGDERFDVSFELRDGEGERKKEKKEWKIKKKEKGVIWKREKERE